MAVFALRGSLLVFRGVGGEFGEERDGSGESLGIAGIYRICFQTALYGHRARLGVAVLLVFHFGAVFRAPRAVHKRRRVVARLGCGGGDRVSRRRYGSQPDSPNLVAVASLAPGSAAADGGWHDPLLSGGGRSNAFGRRRIADGRGLRSAQLAVGPGPHGARHRGDGGRHSPLFYSDRAVRSGLSPPAGLVGAGGHGAAALGIGGAAFAVRPRR